MGADSSTLQSIESLNSTLEGIEKKLFVIEDIHLHHERTISHDEAVLISGKKIICRSGVKLLCGPILGLVGSDFVRLLVETDQDSELSLNVFQTDAQLISTRFVFAVSFPAKKNTPTAFKLVNLQPATNYTVYVGGISPTETVTNYVTFQTMPTDASAMRILLINNGRVDRLLPGESNLWKEVEQRVTAPHSTPPKYFNPTSTEDVFSSPYLPVPPGVSNPTPPIVHLLCHHGNLISIEPMLQSKAVELLDLLTREDSNYEDWYKVLYQLEDHVKEAYRNALTSPSLVKTLRRCGNIFLVGAEEAGIITTSLLALNLPEKLSARFLNADPDSIGFDAAPHTADEASESESTKGTSTKSTTSAKTTGSKKVGKMKKSKSKKGKAPDPDPAVMIVEESRQALVPVPEAVDTQGDIDLTPVIGSAMRRFYDAEQLSVKSKTLVNENLRKLLVGVLVRSLRRIGRSYLRQLWDDEYAALAAEDAEKEIFFRAMLQLQKVLQVKTHLRALLESSRLRMTKEFGVDNKALQHLQQKCTVLGEEITSLEMELREAAVRSGELAVTAAAQPNGVSVQLGSLVLVLVESTWGWLGRDDQVLFPMVTEVEIHEQIQSRLESLLVPPLEHAIRFDKDEDGEGEAEGKQASRPVSAVKAPEVTESEGASGPSKTKNVEVKAVLCISTCPLLPHTAALESSEADSLKGPATGRVATYRNVNADGVPSFTFSPLDVRRVLQSLAKWQQGSPDRAVLLSGPAGVSVDSAIGFAAPFVVTSAGVEITSDAQFEDPKNVSLDIWNRERSRLQQVLVGDLSRVSRTNMAHFQNLALIHAKAEGKDALLTSNKVTDRATLFKSYYDRTTQCVRRCFWDVCFAPQLPPLPSAESSTGVRAAPPAAFVTDCVTDGRRGTVNFSLGPIIGGVTSSSANVLVQVDETAPLELLCVDQITGSEFVCSRLATAHRPCVFQFEHLLPNHAYDIVLLSAVGGNASSSGVLWGSFTTLRGASAILAHTMSGASHDPSVVQSLRQATGGGGGPSLGGASVGGASDLGSQGGERGASNHASASIRLLLLGSDKPSWRSKHASIVQTHTAPASTVSSGLGGLDRVHLTRGVDLCQEITNCLSQGWSGVDVVIHTGYAVDWGSTVDGVLNLLSQAEIMESLRQGTMGHHQYAVSSNNLPLPSGGEQALTRRSHGNLPAEPTTQGMDYTAAAETLRLRALEQLRGAFLTHWGATPHTSALLAHGNHYFLNSPVVELLNIFHAASLRDLRRDLSPYCVYHLMQFVAQLQLEYQIQVTCPAHSVVLQSSHHADVSSVHASAPYLRQLDGGAIALFELQPNFSFDADSLHRVGDKLIPEEQMHALQRLLFPSSGPEQDPAQLRGSGSSTLHTLVLLSPFPVVSQSDEFAEYSRQTGQQKGLRYAQRETVHLLDTLALWLEQSPLQREVIIITGGVATSFITTIHVENTARHHGRHHGHHSHSHDGHSPHPHRAASPTHHLHEESQSSLLSRPPAVRINDAPHSPVANGAHGAPHTPGTAPSAHAVRIRQMCCGALVGIREDSLPPSEGTLLSAQRRFHFAHRTCEYGTGNELHDPTGNTRPQTAATSGTAAAAEATRAGEYHPQCGLVEIACAEAKMRMHQLSLQQSTTQILSPQPGPGSLHQMSHDTAGLGEASHLEPPHKEATLKFLDQAALKTHFARGWPPVVAAPDGHSTAPGAGATGGVSVAGSLASAMHPGTSHVRSIVSQSRLRSIPALFALAQDVSHMLPTDTGVAAMNDPFVVDIRRAMDIICQRERTPFLECHQLYLRHDTFPLPLSGGFNVERCLIATSTWILSKMQPATRAVCKVPSSFVARFVWEHFERQATRVAKPADAGGKNGDSGEGLLAEYVSASMAGDAEYFVSVLRCCLEVQLFVEYQAYSRGMLDGSER